MSNYSIKDLQSITGIKAHTIRIWEKRYGVVKPMRTESNIRYYCENDLKKLLNISLLVKHGYKISKLTELNTEQLGEKIREVTMLQNGHDCHIEGLIMAMIELDEGKVEKILNASIIREGFENTIFNIIYPLFDRIGILWQTGSILPVHNSFIINLIRQKIYVAIDGQTVSDHEDGKTFVLFLPEWEMHEPGLLAFNYILRNSGHKVIYFGQNTSLDDLGVVVEKHQPDYLLTFFNSPVDSAIIETYLTDLSDTFKKIQIFISGIQVRNLEADLPQNISNIISAADFKAGVLSA